MEGRTPRRRGARGVSRRAASASWSGAECARSWSVEGGSAALLMGSSCRVVV